MTASSVYTNVCPTKPHSSSSASGFSGTKMSAGVS